MLPFDQNVRAVHVSMDGEKVQNADLIRQTHKRNVLPSDSHTLFNIDVSRHVKTSIGGYRLVTVWARMFTIRTEVLWHTVNCPNFGLERNFGRCINHLTD